MERLRREGKYLHSEFKELIQCESTMRKASLLYF